MPVLHEWRREMKTLEGYIKSGRNPAYLKNGDIITEQLALDVIRATEEGEGYLDADFEIVQGKICEDIIGNEGVYQTIWRESPEHPWRYIGMCAAGKDKNLDPVHAKKTYICSRYRARNEEKLQMHIRDAIDACRKVHEEGNIPVAPHLYWPRFLNDNDPQDRDYGIAAGLMAMRECDEMIVLIRTDGPEEEWISQGMEAEIREAVKIGIDPRFEYISREKR